MITVGGNTYDVSALKEEYSSYGAQRQLLDTMSESSYNYKYDNEGQLKFEINLRNEIAEAAKQLNRSGFSFAVFHKSECNPRYWERTGNGGFLLKKGVSPSAAINDIFENGSLYSTECATAMQIVYYKALLEVYGRELFDKTFTRIYLMDWHSIHPLLEETGTPVTVRDILTGDRCYIANPDFDPEYPEWQGENVIVLGNGMYYGHGIGIMPLNRFIYLLNRQRRRNASRSAYFLESTAARPDFKKLADIYLNHNN